MAHEQERADSVLLEWIQQRIRETGPVPFARFMEWALYHPYFGYYSAGPALGPRGDFVTSPEASPAFGRLLAYHIADIDTLLGHPSEFSLIECGPGLGTLAADLLDTLVQVRPELYARLHYILVEVSPALTERQRARLGPAHASVTSWAASLEELPRGQTGALLGNEVVDAFPVHVLENLGGALQEWFVDLGEGTDLTITPHEPSDPELVRFIQRYGLDLLPGERVEINLTARQWISQVDHALGRGVATIIDYGDTQPARYSPARRQGTLLAYFGGSVTDRLLLRPGHQDLTALVDFTALADDAVQAGLPQLALTRQAPFLLGLGLGTAVAIGAEGDLQSALNARRGLHALISPEGLGRFHVLLLGKGVGTEEALKGLRGLRYADPFRQ